MRIADEEQDASQVISVGHSIVKRTSDLDADTLCEHYGGGGHEKAADCQADPAEGDRVFHEIIAACKE